MPAGGLLLSSSGAFRLNREALELPGLQDRSPLGRPARRVNMTELGKALAELDQPPVKALVVYNSNPGRNRAEPEPGARGSGARGPVHRGARAVPDGYGGLCRYRAARHHVSGAHRPVLLLRALLPATCAGGCCSRRARQNRMSRCSGCSPRAWDSRTPASAIRKTI